MKFRDAFNRHILLLGILIVVAGLIAGTETLLDKSHEIIGQVESVITDYPVLGKLLFVLLALASAMFAFFSSAVITPIGIYAWGSVETFVLLWIGWLLGGITSFLVGRYLGRSVVSVLLGESRLSSWETQLDRRRFRATCSVSCDTVFRCILRRSQSPSCRMRSARYFSARVS
jgi:uncharacterized membrane protein YdjX (TVP38/TMEM64 family)